jgi:hypothetical protein
MHGVAEPGSAEEVGDRGPVGDAGDGVGDLVGGTVQRAGVLDPVDEHVEGGHGWTVPRSQTVQTRPDGPGVVLGDVRASPSR